MSTGSITYSQFRIGEALKARLDENGGKFCVIQMKLDGVQITLSRKMFAEDITEDRFMMSSDQRFCWGAKPNCGIYVMSNITWRRVLRVLDNYCGKVE